MQAARVLIVDDHALFREGIRAAIERDGDFVVVGEASDGSEALPKARELRPDLILMDISMPGLNGLEATRTIKCELPQAKIIMLTVHGDETNCLDAIKGGAEGFLTKSIRAQALRRFLRGAMKGEAAISRLMFAAALKELARLGQLEAGQVDGRLTCREKQVLGKLRDGLSNREIADALYISENTVKAHLGHIFKKLHLHNRSAAATYARRMGL